jgi:hypothetical protein
MGRREKEAVFSFPDLLALHRWKQGYRPGHRLLASDVSFLPRFEEAEVSGKVRWLARALKESD